MGHAIIELDGAYLVWSSVVDAPITYGLTEYQLLCWLDEQHGANGRLWWDRVKARVEMTGSSETAYTVEQILSNNRAGPGEIELTKQEIIEAYCRRKPLGEWHA